MAGIHMECCKKLFLNNIILHVISISNSSLYQYLCIHIFKLRTFKLYNTKYGNSTKYGVLWEGITRVTNKNQQKPRKSRREKLNDTRKTNRVMCHNMLFYACKQKNPYTGFRDRAEAGRGYGL